MNEGQAEDVVESQGAGGGPITPRREPPACLAVFAGLARSAPALVRPSVPQSGRPTPSECPLRGRSLLC